MLARRQKNECKIDLAEFIANRAENAVEHALKVGWEMEEGEQKLERSKLTRLYILYAKLNVPCLPECDGKWLEMAKIILQKNGICSEEFAEAIVTLGQRQSQRTAVKHFC